jgi:hypothetical protein
LGKTSPDKPALKAARKTKWQLYKPIYSAYRTFPSINHPYILFRGLYGPHPGFILFLFAQQ